MIHFSQVWIEADDLSDPRLDRFEAFAEWLDTKLTLPAEVSVECTHGDLVPPQFESENAVGVFMIFDPQRNQVNDRFHVVVALGEQGEDEAAQQSRLETLAHELLHVEDFARLYPGRTPAQAYAADQLFRWHDSQDSDSLGDPYEDSTEARARQLTAEFLRTYHTSAWKESIKQPPSIVPPSPVIQQPLPEDNGERSIEIKMIERWNTPHESFEKVYEVRTEACTADAAMDAVHRAVLILLQYQLNYPSAYVFEPGLYYVSQEHYDSELRVTEEHGVLHGFTDDERFAIYNMMMGVRTPKNSAKLPPSNPNPPLQQLQFGPTTHKWIMNYFTTYRSEPIDENDPDGEYDYVEVGTNEDQIICDGDPDITPVEFAVDWLARSGLTETSGDECFYDPDGSQQNYRTGDDIAESACLNGFTPEEIAQVHQFLTQYHQWTPPRKWGSLESPWWKPDWVAQARKIRDMMMNVGLWGEDNGFFEQELATQIEENMGVPAETAYALADGVLEELKSGLTDQSLGYKLPPGRRPGIGQDSPPFNIQMPTHGLPDALKGVGPYYGKTSVHEAALYRGVYCGQMTSAELGAALRNLEAFLLEQLDLGKEAAPPGSWKRPVNDPGNQLSITPQYSTLPEGWTEEWQSAYNYGMNRDFEGWALEMTPGDDEELEYTVGIVYDAILSSGTYEVDEFAHEYDAVSINPGVEFEINGGELFATDNRTNIEHQYYQRLSQRHVAKTAGLEDFIPGTVVQITGSLVKGENGMTGYVHDVNPANGSVYVMYNDATTWRGQGRWHWWRDLTPFLQVQEEPVEEKRRFKAGVDDILGFYRLYQDCPVEFVRGMKIGETGVVKNLNSSNGTVAVLLDNPTEDGGMQLIWVPHECLEPFLHVQQELPDRPRRWKPSHVFDPKQVTLDPLVFDHEDRLLPRLQKFIQHEVEQLFSRSGLGHQHFTSYLSGPIASYRYNPLGDADLYIVPDYDNLPPHSDRDELYKHWQNQAVEHIDGTHLPGTRHRLHALVVKPGVSGFDLFNDKDRPAWDFSKQDWLVRPVREHSDESQALEHHIERAHEIGEKVQMLGPRPKREYRNYLKQRSDEEPNLFSTPTMVFMFLNDQKLAASPQDKFLAQQTMQSIKDSGAYQQLYAAHPEQQQALDTFTNNLVQRDPQLHPLFWHGINSVAEGQAHPIGVTTALRSTHRVINQMQDDGHLPPDFSPNQHASLGDMNVYLMQQQDAAKLQAQRKGGEEVYRFSDGWHVDLARPEEAQHHADWFSLGNGENPIEKGEIVGYTIRDQDDDPRVLLTFGHSGRQNENSNWADYFRPHTLHPGTDWDGTWEVVSIGYMNKHKERPHEDRWNDDTIADEHGREWIQHMKQWGQRFNGDNVIDEAPSIDGARDLESWYEDNFSDRDGYKDPSDPFGFGEGELPSADLDDLVEKCIYGVLAGADRNWGDDAVSDELGLADAFYELWKLDPKDNTPLQTLAEKADEFVYEQFDEWMEQNYSYFAEQVREKFSEDRQDFLTKAQQYELEQLEEEDDEDGGNRKEERLDEIFENMQDEDEDMWYALNDAVRDEWWKYSPYEDAGAFASRLHEHAQNLPKQSAKEPPSAWQDDPEPSAPMFERLPGELPEQPVQNNQSYGVGGTLDERDLAILHQRVLAYDKIPGPRVGDWVRWAGGSMARFCHDWGDQLQTTDGPNGGSFHLGDGYISYSGGLDPGVLKSTLHQTGELKLGSVWFFHHDHSGGGRGVHAQMDFRVFDSDPQNEDAWWRKRQPSASSEKLKVVYDFDGDRISLGTLSEVQGNPHIIGEYDGKDVHLDQPENAWLNKDYFSQLWQTQFPERPLENVHINIAAPKLAMGLNGDLPEGIQFIVKEWDGIVECEAYLGREVIAYITVDHGGILGITVEPEYQRMGVATTMLEYLRKSGYDVEHDWDNMSNEGWNWAEAVDGVPEGVEYPTTDPNPDPYRRELDRQREDRESAKQPFNQDDRSQYGEVFDLPEPMQLMLQAGEDLHAEPGSIEVANHAKQPMTEWPEQDGTHWARLFYLHKGKPAFADQRERENYVQSLIDDYQHYPDEARDMADDQEWVRNHYNKDRDGSQCAADYYYYPDQGWVLGAN